MSPWVGTQGVRGRRARARALAHLCPTHVAGTKGRTVDLEDIKFHQCVKLNRFEGDRTISFIPPDGEFDLMSYRLNTKVRTAAPQYPGDHPPVPWEPPPSTLGTTHNTLGTIP